MAIYTVWMLEKLNISINPPTDLDGNTQGDGSHLEGRTITLNNGNFLQTFIEDTDTDFEDNDASQRLSGQQTINDGTYVTGTRVEAEYRLILQDSSDPLRQWTVYGYNVNNSTPAYASVEGLAFRPAEDGSFP